ncbi:MAG TPA: response regulator [Verrucomicrobiae bacterium]|jgi:CheY-like chemotaxis protein|nr:response regulator [Verrucomicrobiae bacterium]
MPGEGKKIFFVEDSDVERLAYQRVLERAGYQVEVARDGLEGLKLLHTVVPDLVLLDLLLPKFDGVEVLKFIRSNSRLKSVPIVIFSTNSIIEVQDEPLLEGANRRLLKCQCNPALMLETIHDIFLEQEGKGKASGDAAKPDLQHTAVKH